MYDTISVNNLCKYVILPGKTEHFGCQFGAKVFDTIVGHDKNYRIYHFYRSKCLHTWMRARRHCPCVQVYTALFACLEHPRYRSENDNKSKKPWKTTKIMENQGKV